MTTPAWIANALINTRTSLRLAFPDVQGRSKPFVMDIFPHRLTPKDGVTIEDTILSLIATAHTYYPGQNTGGFIRHSLQTWIAGWAHPDVEIREGAVLVHMGDATDAEHLFIDQDTITLPDGRRFPRTQFSPRVCYEHQQTSRHLGYFDKLMQPTEPQDPQRVIFHSIALGAISCFLHTGYHFQYDTAPNALPLTPKDLVGAVMARTNRLLNNNLTGVTAMQRGLNDAEALVNHLVQPWVLRPNRGWMPQTWVGSPLLDTLLDWANPQAVQAGKAIAAAALDTNIKGSEAFLDRCASAHETLTLRLSQAELDHVLLRHCDPAWLAPRAATQAKKLQPA